MPLISSRRAGATTFHKKRVCLRQSLSKIQVEPYNAVKRKIVEASMDECARLGLMPCMRTSCYTREEAEKLKVQILEIKKQQLEEFRRGLRTPIIVPS